MSQVVAVIPARFGAQRFPGKALAPILGKPMIHWVVEGVSQSKLIKKIIVATDDQRISDVCQKLNVKVVMTSPELASGSDRVYEAIKNEPEELILNIQGDEPLIQGSLVDQMAQAMIEESEWEMFTLAESLDDQDLDNPSVAKILLNQRQEAIYFSRFPIPYSRGKKQPKERAAALKHIGLYGYKKDFLRMFCQTPPVTMEKMEGLEQLRALYLGGRIKVLRVDYESRGVDTPEDVEKVEKNLRARNG